MPTSVHLSQELLRAVNRKAKALRISRNQFVVRALQREVESSEWSAGFFESLTADAEVGKAVDEMATAIRKSRSSKPARLVSSD
jgi:predicted transcriptional regulator